MFYNKKNAYELLGEEKEKQMLDFCEEYKEFLSNVKTERESVIYTVESAKAFGFEDIAKKKRLQKGDKVYSVNKNRSVIFAVIGDDPVESGINVVAAHIDTPRIDLKQNPLYEAENLALFKTHYYGGIKKYQWTAIPLEIRGVVFDRLGKKIDIKINDPVFTITDLLPHLAQEQMGKKVSEAVKGEDLNLLVGSKPIIINEDNSKNEEKEKDKIKANIKKLILDQYGICEEDFVSAELCLVPAFDACDVGFDRSMIGAYGQDDRVCSFTAFKALLSGENFKKTAVVVLADKEEIGSMGNTGMQSRFFENFVAKLCYLTLGIESGISVRNTLENSVCLSADVGAAIDPTYKSVSDPLNSAKFNGGILVTKYTGSRGKGGTSDASAEMVSRLRNMLNKHGIPWQTGELGRVDQGGGGTVAQFIANLGLEVIDCGVPLLSMHSPFEVSAKLDVFAAFLTYKIFLSEAV